MLAIDVVSWFRRCKKIAVIASLILLCGGLLQASEAPVQEPVRRILLIHGMGQDSEWSGSISRGVEAALAGADSSIQLHIENVDTTRFEGADYPSLANYIARKYQATPPDILIATDGNALNFIKQYRAQMYPQIPLVFTAAGLLNEAEMQALGDAYQVDDGVDYSGNIALIKQLFPDTTTLAFVGRVRSEEARLALEQALVTAKSEFAEVRDYSQLSLEAALAKLQQLPPQSAVLLGAWLINANGQRVEVNDLLAKVTDATEAPVLANYAPMLRNGILGGVMVDGEARGRALVELALQLLADDPLAEMPRTHKVRQPILLSYAELERLNLLNSPRLPEGSLIVGRPHSLYELYPLMIAGGISALVLLLLLILLLVAALHVRQRTMAQMANNEARYRRMFEVHPSPLIVYESLSLRILAINQAFTQVIGYSAEEILGQPITLLVIAEQHPKVAARVSQLHALADAVPGKAQWTVLTKDGRQLEIEFAGRSIAFGASAARVVQFRDISQSKAAEAALKASEQRLNQIIDGSPLATVVLDAAQRVSHWNRAMERLSGINAAQVIGQRHDLARLVGLKKGKKFLLQALLDGDRAEQLNQLGRTQVRPHPSHAGGLEADIFLDGPDGPRWLHCVAVPLQGDDGSVLGAIESMIDITELKQAGVQLQQLNTELEQRVGRRMTELSQANEHLQRAMQQLVHSEKLAALGGLVAGIAHELNTPIGNALTVVTTLDEHLQAFQRDVVTNNLKRSQVSGFIAACDEACQLLERNTARAAELVASFKQVAVDQTSVRRRRFKLQQALEETLRTVSPLYKHEPVQLRLQMDSSLELNSYPGPLEQVVTNLIGNAVLHARGDKPQLNLLISAEAAQVEGQAGVVMHIRDDGVGMDEATASKVFAPFFTTRLGQGGSGLGLYVVHNLVTGVLAGRISLHTAPGQGACFTLMLPYEPLEWSGK